MDCHECSPGRELDLELDAQQNVSFPGFADKLKADYDIGMAQVSVRSASASTGHGGR